MKIIATTNQHGSIWTLKLDSPTDGRFLPCDRVITAYSNTSAVDFGYGVVIEVGADFIVIDVGGTGMTPTAAHVIRRRVDCSCACHHQ